MDSDFGHMCLGARVDNSTEPYLSTMMIAMELVVVDSEVFSGADPKSSVS